MARAISLPVLIPQGEGHHRFKDALSETALRGHRICLEFFSCQETFLRHLQKSLSTAAVVDPYLGGPDGMGTVLRLRTEWPEVELLIYADFRHRPVVDVVRMSAAGVREFVTFGVDDSPDLLAAALLRVILRAEGGELDQVLELLGAGLDETGVSIIRAAFDIAACGLGLDELIVTTGGRRRQLERLLRRRDLPPPRDLLVRARVVYGTILLRRGPRSCEDLSYQLGFAEGGGFRRAAHRVTGMWPKELARIATPALLAEVILMRRRGSWGSVAWRGHGSPEFTPQGPESLIPVRRISKDLHRFRHPA